MDEEKIRSAFERMVTPDYWAPGNLVVENKVKKQIPVKERPTPKKLSLEVSMLARDRSYGDSRSYRVNRGGDCVLKLTQVPFPECCGIAIFKNVSLSSSLSMDDFNIALDLIIDDLVANDKFSKVLFYTTDSSKEARAFSAAKNIVITDKFLNRRSTNYLIGFELDINPKKVVSDSHDLDFVFEEPTEDDEYYSNDDLYDGDDYESSANDHFRQEMANLSLAARSTQIANCDEDGLYTRIQTIEDYNSIHDKMYPKVVASEISMEEYLKAGRDMYKKDKSFPQTYERRD